MTRSGLHTSIRKRASYTISAVLTANRGFKIAADAQSLSKLFVAVAQLRQICGKYAANIEEGYGRGFGRDDARFLIIALGSARETRGWYLRARPPAKRNNA
jgi:four helix bundle protein